MSTKIPTLYSNYQECILDLDIYGKIVSTPHQSIRDMTDALFEEFKRRKPLPTLEYQRYELSKLVSSDYRIVYNRELELQDNESLVDLTSNSSKSNKVIFEDLSPLIREVQEVFSYENEIHDDLRQTIIDTYDLATGEEFKPGIKQTEDIVGSVSIDTTVYTEEEIEKLGVDSEYELDEDSSSAEIDDDFSDYDSYSDEDENIEESEESNEDTDDFSDYDYDTQDEVESDEGDSEDEDFSDYDDYEVVVENDSETDEYADYNYSEEEQEEDIEESSVSSDSEFIDSILNDEDIDFVDDKVDSITIKTPPTPAQIPIQSKPEVVDRSEEPTDIRQFLRKHPRCEYEFALKYFTKKQINDAIRIGKIIKKGNILKI